MKLRTLLAASVALFGTSAAQEIPVDDRNFYSFGDSLSDNGNFAAVIEAGLGDWPNANSYYRGRFSNGPNWVDLLSLPQARYPGLETLQAHPAARGINFAHGLVQSGADFSGVVNSVSVTRQVRAFAALVNDGQVSIGDQDVVTLWTGANDYLVPAPNRPADVVRTIEKEVADLIDLGAKTILIVNLPDLGQTPAGLQAKEPYAAYLTQLSRAHNRYLAEAVDRLSNTTAARVLLVDVETPFKQVASEPEAFGFTVLDRSCISEGLLGDDCPEDWLFYDEVHPTYRAHIIIAQIAADRLAGR